MFSQPFEFSADLIKRLPGELGALAIGVPGDRSDQSVDHSDGSSKTFLDQLLSLHHLLNHGHRAVQIHVVGADQQRDDT